MAARFVSFSTKIAHEKCCSSMSRKGTALQVSELLTEMTIPSLVLVIPATPTVIASNFFHGRPCLCMIALSETRKTSIVGLETKIVWPAASARRTFPDPFNQPEVIEIRDDVGNSWSTHTSFANQICTRA